MPYIKKNERRHYESGINLLVNRLSQRDFKPGDLTYVLYALAVRVMRSQQKDYVTLSRTRASIDDASFEFYRVEIAPYEDEKLRENGAV